MEDEALLKRLALEQTKSQREAAVSAGAASFDVGSHSAVGTHTFLGAPINQDRYMLARTTHRCDTV